MPPILLEMLLIISYVLAGCIAARILSRRLWESVDLCQGYDDYIDYHARIVFTVLMWPLVLLGIMVIRPTFRQVVRWIKSPVEEQIEHAARLRRDAKHWKEIADNSNDPEMQETARKLAELCEDQVTALKKYDRRRET